MEDPQIVDPSGKTRTVPPHLVRPRALHGASHTRVSDLPKMSFVDDDVSVVEGVDAAKITGSVFVRVPSVDMIPPLACMELVCLNSLPDPLPASELRGSMTWQCLP